MEKIIKRVLGLVKCADKRAFTLIELLTTLAIMAVIAALLFPFVSNYTQQAQTTSATRSMRILQDAIDRYVSVQATNWTNDWTTNTSVTNVAATDRTDLNPTDVAQIISDISAPSANQTLRQPATPITSAMVKVFLQGNGTSSNYVVWRYRMTPTGSGVDRNGNIITTANFTNSSTNLDGE